MVHIKSFKKQSVRGDHFQKALQNAYLIAFDRYIMQIKATSESIGIQFDSSSTLQDVNTYYVYVFYLDRNRETYFPLSALI